MDNEELTKKTLATGRPTSAEVLQLGGGVTDEQRRDAQAFIDKMSRKHAGFKMPLDDLLVLHITHNMSFEQIESSIKDML